MRSAVPQRRARSKPAVKGGALESPRRCAVRRTWGLNRTRSKLLDPFENRLERKVCKGVMKLKRTRYPRGDAA